MKRQNKWKAGKKSFIFLLVSGLLVLGNPPWRALSPTVDHSYAAESLPANQYEENIGRIIERTNEERVRQGLAPLTEDKTLAAAATIRACELKECFAHVRPDGSRFYTVFPQYGIGGTWRGENLARGLSGAHTAVMNAWMESESHRNNILNGSFTRIGIGYVEMQGTAYWCQLFAN